MVRQNIKNLQTNLFGPYIELPTGMTTIDWCGFFVLWHINLCGLFNVKAILIEKQLWYYLTDNGQDKWFMPFSRILVQKGT